MDNYGIQHSGHGNINNSGAVGPGATVNFNHTPPPETSSTDVGVITVLSEELTAVVEVLRRGIGYRKHADAAGRVVHEALVPLDSTGDTHVAALQTTNRGQRPAGHAFEYLRRQFAPAVVVLVGIAGGIHPDLRPGDVVIGDEIVYYDRRKETPTEVKHRGESGPVPAVARRMINEFFRVYGEPTVLADAHGPYRVFRGPIGSGEAVVASAASGIRTYLTAYNDKTLALETEAGGVALAFHETTGSKPAVQAWFTIRGISDLADSAKDDRHHHLAALRAAEVFEAMLPYLHLPRG